MRQAKLGLRGYKIRVTPKGYSKIEFLILVAGKVLGMSLKDGDVSATEFGLVEIILGNALGLKGRDGVSTELGLIDEIVGRLDDRLNNGLVVGFTFELVDGDMVSIELGFIDGLDGGLDDELHNGLKDGLVVGFIF